MKNQQIVIVGFMGAGKTTVARKLGRKLNSLAVDLDELITRHEGRSPNEIIEQDGEQKFREIETQRLREVLAEAFARIIAVGGGAWTMPANRALIAEYEALTVWLDAPFEMCWTRIEADDAFRPLARSREMAERLYNTRRPDYELADARILVSASDSGAAVATRVVTWIEQGARRS